ncbi:phosphomannomutase/phosphoglucomutase, partial [Escherichia coli]
DFAQTLFSQLGYCCIMLNASPDGNFPQGNPDPTQFNRLTQLAQTVKATGSDIGLAFDGDGDRVMVIDAQGQMISPDNLLYLLSRIAIEEL